MRYELILLALGLAALLLSRRDRRPSTTFEHALDALKTGGFKVAESDNRRMRYENNRMSFFYSHTETDNGLSEVVDFIVFGTKGGYALHFVEGRIVRWLRNGISPNAFAIPADRQIIAGEILRRVRSITHQLNQGA